MSETFNLDRELNIEHNVDALGKKWNIVHIRGSSLYEARPEPYRSDFQCPEEFGGRWTKPTLLQDQITKYVTSTWDHSAKLDQKRARKKVANKAKEHEDSMKTLPQEIKDDLGDAIK